MDDCGEREIFPGILSDDCSYEHKEMLQNKLEDFCESWEYNKGYWAIHGVMVGYFDIIYSPYVYHVLQETSLYDKKFTPNYIEISDPHYNAVLNLNYVSMITKVRQRVLLIVCKEQGGGLLIEPAVGVGQFLPLPVVNSNLAIHVKKNTRTQSVHDNQKVYDSYDGNSQEWFTRSTLQKEHKKCREDDWPIICLNESLGKGYTSVSTIDALNRLLLVADLCSHLDFYIWLGSCVDMWINWPFVMCEGITEEQYTQKNSFTQLVRKNLVQGGIKRHNVYLGCHSEVIKKALPFFSSVSNGVFTLEEE